MPSLSALERIRKIQDDAAAEIAKLTDDAVTALKEERKGLLDQVKKLDKEIAELTGKAPKTGGGKIFGGVIGNGKASIADAKELKALLSKADGKKLNRKGINDAGYSLKSALAIAKADPKTFAFEQNGPQGTVSLK